MFFTKDKFNARINELEQYRYRDCKGIDSFYIADDNGEIGALPPQNYSEERQLQIGDYWRGRDKYLWLHTEIDNFDAFKDKQVAGIFSFGKTGGGNNSGFESLLFVNGKPYQGVDSNHEEVLFDKEVAAQSLTLDFRLWSGLEGGGVPQENEFKLETAKIGWLDKKMDDLYYTLLATLEVLTETNEHDPVYLTLQEMLTITLRQINWTEPGSEQFYESCYLALEQLKQQVKQNEKSPKQTVHTVGHTHIDVAWLWRLKHTREKAARSFSTVLHLMKQYPEYLFLQTQPQLYAYIKKDYPDIYKQIKERIKEGKWEPGGAMWLESDCNIPSGESLVRQILHGKNFLKEEFDLDCTYLWLPDVFGYSWALPQILRKSGIKTMMTTKISWNQYNRMPHDTFYWKGMDGSEILTHFITTPEPWNPPESWHYTYNGFITAKSVKGVWNSYQDKELSNDVLVSYGYGDGGGGVNRHMLEMRRRFDELPGMPNVKPATAGQFFEKLHDNIENADGYVHKWDGELYLEYHRGTYTSQAFMKKMNRKLELLYREAEFLSTWLTNGNGHEAAEQLKDGWNTILRNQFHDIIPGSSITEVYQDAKEEYQEAYTLAKQVEKEVLSPKVGKSENHFTIVNPMQTTGKQNVWIDHDAMEGYWQTSNGEVLISQQVGDKWLVEVDQLPAFGVKELQFVPQKIEQKQQAFSYENGKLETPFYSISLNEYGQITNLYDKEHNRSVLVQGEKANVFQMFEDKPLAHDAWDIDIFYQEKMTEVNHLISSEFVVNGPLTCELKLTYQYHHSTIDQRILFYANNRRIDFKTHVDWNEKHQLLKVAFPIDVRSTEATYDIQYGNVTRPTHWNTSWDMARFESVGHMWADLSETGYGVSLLNDSKYGYDIKEQNMRLTLLKSATHPDPHADQGEHDFTYAILPHIGDWRDAKTVEEAWSLNAPLQALNGKWQHETQSFMHILGDNIWVDAVKEAYDGNGMIIRFHEYKGMRNTITIELDHHDIEWVETDLMEQPIGNVTKEPITMQVHPYEIKTIRVLKN